MPVPEPEAGVEALRRTADELLPTFYADVRRIARAARLRAGEDGTLQTTALVHEAYLRLRRSPAFADRSHFLRASAIAMRQVLVNHARDSIAAKRGGGAVHVPLEFAEGEAVLFEGNMDDTVLAVHRLMDQLAERSPRLSQVIECRFFAGYNEVETAEALDVDERTVRRDWVKARAWLRAELERENVGGVDG
ncbi:MAG TPA: ECF-type sigma factor [Nevskiaceae bacterium]|nr:ECF-type sigma factor [Nevskiaceae bacterium]